MSTYREKQLRREAKRLRRINDRASITIWRSGQVYTAVGVASFAAFVIGIFAGISVMAVIGCVH